MGGSSRGLGNFSKTTPKLHRARHFETYLFRQWLEIFSTRHTCFSKKTMPDWMLAIMKKQRIVKR